MTHREIDDQLACILRKYQHSLSEKDFVEESDSSDILMETLGITQETKNINKQYWGRELGMCWQLLVTELCKTCCSDYATALKIGEDEPCDLILGNDAVDTKYRVGSGDSGTLKKFRQYGLLLQKQGYRPLVLLLREDNLSAAISAFQAGGWEIYTGQNSFNYVKEKTDFDLYAWLVFHKNNKTFFINKEQ